MNYVGVDVHKRYSVLCALDGSGRKLREARVEGNAPSGFGQFFACLDGPSNLVARAHVPSRQTRARKNLLRQRLYWARLRTMLRNRMHALLDRQRRLELPQCSDIFGVRGLSFLRALQLAQPDATLLREQLA